MPEDITESVLKELAALGITYVRTKKGKRAKAKGEPMQNHPDFKVYYHERRLRLAIEVKNWQKYKEGNYYLRINGQIIVKFKDFPDYEKLVIITYLNPYEPEKNKIVNELRREGIRVRELGIDITDTDYEYIAKEMIRMILIGEIMNRSPSSMLGYHHFFAPVVTSLRN